MATTKTSTSKAQTSDSVQKNWDDLSEKVERLKADMSAINDSLAGLAKAGVSEGRERMRSEMDDLARKTRELTDDLNQRGRDMARDASHQAGELSRELEATINRNPMTSILVALGLGFIIGLMTRGRD